jgi:hypothetical protein
VRHILILISILLLSSPVIGDNHKGETLYRWDTSSGVVWKGFGEKDTNPKYQGDVENGKPNGLGFLIYPNGDKYVGGWKDGRRNGQGTFTLPDGGTYVGGWKDGKEHGHGTLTFPDGKRYEGKWQDGNYHGHGTYTFGKWYLKLDNQDGIIYHFFSKKDKLDGDEKFFQLLK